MISVFFVGQKVRKEEKQEGLGEKKVMNNHADRMDRGDK